MDDEMYVRINAVLIRARAGQPEAQAMLFRSLEHFTPIVVTD